MRSCYQLALQLALALTFGEIFSISGVDQAAISFKKESFDRDPQWEGYNNHAAPKQIRTVAQDFGYAASNFAGKETGEIGGQIWRSATRASYATAIPPKILQEKLTASGTFAVTKTSGSSGAYFGWFNSEHTGSGRRDTLGF